MVGHALCRDREDDVAIDPVESKLEFELSSPMFSTHTLPSVPYQVETTGTKELTNAPRIGGEFKERVANPKDVIQYYKKKTFISKSERVPIHSPSLLQ
jgi:hypothetical protein